MQSIITVDSQYIRPQFAACYLIPSRKDTSMALIETSTCFLWPHLQKVIAHETRKIMDITHIIVTHAHLDHAGGSGTLLQKLDACHFYAHPKALRVLRSPERLIESAKKVYGEENFSRLYGEILPVPKERSHEVLDTPIDFDGGRLYAFETLGHASHHISLWDNVTESVFTGDTFGLYYPFLQKNLNHPFIFPSTSPIDFDPENLRMSIKKILDCKPRTIYPTHYGALHKKDIGKAQSLLMDLVDFSEQLIQSTATIEPEKRFQTLFQLLMDKLFDAYLVCGGTETQWKSDVHAYIEFDVSINVQGLLIAYEKYRKRQ